MNLTQKNEKQSVKSVFNQKKLNKILVFLDSIASKTLVHAHQTFRNIPKTFLIEYDQ